MLKQKIKNTLVDLYSLVYPSFCPACSEALEMNESVMCTQCRIALPRTRFKPASGNQIEKHFWGKVKLESAVAFLQFHKGNEVMHLLHELKYKGNQDVGESLGRMFASEYKESGFFNEIEVIIPVPLHKSRQRIRGYNQCDSICKGVSELTDIPVAYNGLVRTSANESQTSKGRFERYVNTKELFRLNKKNISGNHVLIIDDVITTGSTVEACARPLIESGYKVSVASIAAPID